MIPPQQADVRLGPFVLNRPFVNGDFRGKARRGALGIDTSTGDLYQNVGTSGQPVWVLRSAASVSSSDRRWFACNIYESGATITAGIKGSFTVTAGTIAEVRLYTTESGNITIDLWRTTWSGVPPTNANSITGTAKPTLVGGTPYRDIVLPGWQKVCNDGDEIMVNVESSTVHLAKLALLLI